MLNDVEHEDDVVIVKVGLERFSLAPQEEPAERTRIGRCELVGPVHGCTLGLQQLGELAGTAPDVEHSRPGWDGVER